MRSASSGHFSASVNLVAGGYDVYRGPATLYFFTRSRSTLSMLITSGAHRVFRRAPAPHSIHQRLNVFQFCIRWDAMAQIENMAAPPAHFAQNTAGFRSHGRWGGGKKEWVK